ncbi:MAG: reverse transcriptase family protein [Sedimenticola sp.]
MRRAKRDYERKLIEHVKEDAKSFWSYVRSKTKTKSTIGDIEDSDGVLNSDCLGKAEILNSFFSSVFVNEDTSEVPELPVQDFNYELKDIVVTPELVKKQLLKLNSSKSPGDDQMHPRILKELNNEICESLAVLFNKTISEGRLPSQWKFAVVVPLFKKGNKKKAENYRPVSLTSVVCKVLESIIRNVMMEHMESSELFVKHQHGFRPQHSCVTQLLEVTDEWFDILDKGGNIDCIYLDFRKAFDTVPHMRLSNKLYSYGVRGHVRQWIENFLRDRQQSVRIGTSMSQKSPVTSGIPQGSVLGPILFLIFINDLPEIVTSAVKLFADDTKLYREIASANDCELIQEDLNKLSNWTDTWLLRFNAAKCKSMHLGRQNKQHKYYIEEGDTRINVEQIKLEKDIGVNFDNELKFSEHIAICVKKANQKLGLIRRSFDHLDKDMFITLYKSLVRPTLEYASVIWSPTLKKDIVAIENVQRRATKLVKELSSLSYEERLKNLGLPTLIYRRDRADMVQLYKIMNGFDKAELNSITVASESVTRGNQHKLVKRHYKYKSYMKNFTARCINPWNSLPTECVQSATVNSFKSGLNSEWKHKPNKFYYDF